MDDQTEALPPEAQIDDAPDFDPQLDSLMGDMRDVILQRIRTLQKPWAQMSEQEQVDCANGTELAAKDMIRKTVRLLNQHEWPTAVVELSEMKIGGTKGIEAKIACANVSHNREVLGDYVGTQVMLMMVDSDSFMAARAPAKIDKDQPELPMEGEAEPEEQPEEEAAADTEAETASEAA